MDWNLNPPSWDLAEFAISIHHEVQWSTSPEIGGNCGFTEEPGVARMAQLGSGSSKRARARRSAAGNGAQIAPCLVDGCISDLSRGREYHRRHKVCEQHSKTPQVMIQGHKQRFCQQCSRFHSLEEFDEIKRSCRKRLARHNTRRRQRKPRPDPISCVGSFFSNFQGSQLLSFSNTQVYPSTAWTGAVSSDENAYRHQQLNKHSSFPGSSLSQPLAMSHWVQPDSIPLVTMDSVLISSQIHYPGSFHLGSDESSGNNASQTLPFHWE